MSTNGWLAVAAVGSMLVSFLIGILTYRRGTKGDRALNISQNVASAFEAQKDVINQLQEEVLSARGDSHQCRSECDGLRKQVQEYRHRARAAEAAMAAAQRLINSLEEEIGVLQQTVRAMQEGGHPSD